MKLLTVIGLLLDLVGVIILGMGEVMQGAAGCLENFSRRGRRHRFKMDPIAEPLNPLGKPIYL
jgi:hypothetical protein